MMFENIFHTAKAEIRGGKKYPQIQGTVSFKETKDSVLVTAKIAGLPTSSNACQQRFFGFHIHERNLLYWQCGR